MSEISINDLNPRESTFVFAGKTHSEFATTEEPNGLTNLSNKLIELDAGAITKSCYFLLKDKTDFPLEGDFLEAMRDNFTAIKILLDPFSKCLGVSQPTDDDTADEVELKK